MSENVRFEIPKEMRSMAEASFEQARKTFEKFLDSAKETAGSIADRNETMRAGAKDISSKAIGYAETNVQASLDYAEELLHAKDLPEVMRLHAEYVQGQMRALAEQASEMGQIARTHGDGRHEVETLGARRFRAGQPAVSLGNCRTVASGIMHCSKICIAMHKNDIIQVYGIAAPTTGNPTVNKSNAPWHAAARRGTSFSQPLQRTTPHDPSRSVLRLHHPVRSARADARLRRARRLAGARQLRQVQGRRRNP